MPFALKVLLAPEPKLVGVKLPLGEGENLVGRVSPPAQIKLEGVKVSKKHAVITSVQGRLKIDDLKSSNGVFVNGKKVMSSGLNTKDRIVIGEYVLEVTVE